MRIQWIDISKGIAIILVIVGHTIAMGIVRGPIYSFHMPLFFIASAYTMKQSREVDEWLSKSKKLVIKMLGWAFGMFICRRFLLFIFYRSTINENWIQYVKDTVEAIIWSSGTVVTVSGVTYETIGMVWFLVVLAFSRVLYDFLQMKLYSKPIIRGGYVCAAH